MRHHNANANPHRLSYGVRLRDYFWIISENVYGYSGLAMDTILWSIKKEKWIPGPNLLKSGKSFEFEGPEICLVGVGNEEAYLLMDEKLNLGYNLRNNEWKNGKVIKNYYNGIHPRSCIFHQDKEQER